MLSVRPMHANQNVSTSTTIVGAHKFLTQHELQVNINSPHLHR